MYSQNMEEFFILHYFSHYVGTFLDVGANDGITLSNTRQLALNNWNGLLIEPSPRAFAQLSDLYAIDAPRIEVLEAALHTSDEELILNESGAHLNNGDVGLLSTVNNESLRKWASTTDFKEIPIYGFTLKSILETSNYQTFDFISLDVEGQELELLPQFDFHKLKTKMACIEWNGANWDAFNTIFMRYGFELIHQNNENLIFALPKINF